MSDWLTLPIMPSLNNAFVNKRGGGRFIDRHYAAWKQEAGLKLNQLKPNRLDGPYALHIRLPLKMRGDIDNRIKPLVDLLVKQGITSDDRFMLRVTCERHESVKPKTCEFRLEAVQ